MCAYILIVYAGPSTLSQVNQLLSEKMAAIQAAQAAQAKKTAGP